MLIKYKHWAMLAFSLNHLHPYRLSYTTVYSFYCKIWFVVFFLQYAKHFKCKYVLIERHKSLQNLMSSFVFTEDFCTEENHAGRNQVLMPEKHTNILLVVKQIYIVSMTILHSRTDLLVAWIGGFEWIDFFIFKTHIGILQNQIVIKWFCKTKGSRIYIFVS